MATSKKDLVAAHIVRTETIIANLKDLAIKFSDIGMESTAKIIGTEADALRYETNRLKIEFDKNKGTVTC